MYCRLSVLCHYDFVKVIYLHFHVGYFMHIEMGGGGGGFL
jgi:hypothetical protein